MNQPKANMNIYIILTLGTIFLIYFSPVITIVNLTFLLIFITIKYLHKKPKIIFQDKSVAYVIIFFLIINLISFSQNIINKRAIQYKLQKKLSSIESSLSKEKTKVRSTSNNLAKDPFVVSLIREKQYSSLSGYATNLMISRHLNFLIITDKMGTVIANGHEPKSIGNNLFSKISILTQVLNDKNIVTDSNKIINKPVYISTSPIKDNNQIIGTLSTGYIYDDSFLFNLSNNKYNLALFINGKMVGMSLKDNSLTNLLANSDILFKKSPLGSFIYRNHAYLAAKKNIYNSQSDKIGYFITIDNLGFNLPVFYLSISFIFFFLLFFISSFNPKIKLKNKHFHIYISKKFIRNVKSNLIIYIFFTVIILSNIALLTLPLQLNNVSIKPRLFKKSQKVIFSSHYTKSYLKLNEEFTYQIYANPKKTNNFLLEINFSENNLSLLENQINNPPCVLSASIASSIVLSCQADGNNPKNQLLTTLQFKPNSEGVVGISLSSAQLDYNNIDNFLIESQ